jgi:hypothetical protein
MTTTFQLSANELNNDFLKRIKTLFKDKRIAITIEEDIDETEYLLSTAANRKHLEEAIANVEAGNVVRVDLNTLVKKHTK